MQDNYAAPIRVFLIDDDPSWGLSSIEDIATFFPRLAGPLAGSTSQQHIPFIRSPARVGEGHDEIAPFFELKWIQTPEEACEVRNTWLRLAAQAAEDLGANGCIPDIVCFDYALTGKPPYDEDAWDEHVYEFVSPMPVLRRLREKHGIGVDVPPAPRSDVPRNEDNEGLYSGGLLVSVFPDYPCAPVATTVKPESTIRKTEAALFEYLLDEEYLRAFTKRRAQPSGVTGWQPLLERAVVVLRERLELLTRRGVITPDLKNLLALAGEATGIPGIAFHTRYGSRTFPIQGLFLDQPAKERTQFAATWAAELLQRCWANHHIIRTAVDHCEGFIEEYTTNPLIERRYRLSDLLAKLEDHKDIELVAGQLRITGDILAEHEKAELMSLAKDFPLRRNNKEHLECTGPHRSLAKLSGIDARTERYLILFVMVGLAELFARARARAGQSARVTGIPGLTDTIVAKALSVTEHDVYLALNPLPTGGAVILPFSEGAVKPLIRLHDKTLEDNKTEERGPIRERKRGDRGNLALSIPDVLNMRPWGAPSGQPNKESSWGLLPGELLLMQAYADSIGFARADWPPWLLSTPFPQN